MNVGMKGTFCLIKSSSQLYNYVHTGKYSMPTTVLCCRGHLTGIIRAYFVFFLPLQNRLCIRNGPQLMQTLQLPCELFGKRAGRSGPELSQGSVFKQRQLSSHSQEGFLYCVNNQSGCNIDLTVLELLIFCSSQVYCEAGLEVCFFSEWKSLSHFHYKFIHFQIIHFWF